MKDELKKIRSIKDLQGVFVNIFPLFFRRKNAIGIFSTCVYRIPISFDHKTLKIYFNINNQEYLIKTLFKRGLHFKKGNYLYFLNLYKIKIDTRKIMKFPPQNICLASFKNKNETLITPIVYNAIYYKKYLGLVGKLYKYTNKNLVAYFRQTRMNSIAITVRENNITDNLKERIKILFAKILSSVTPKSKVILLYEKLANKYEESASCVYEKLIDLGYNNAKYIIRKSSPHCKLIPDEYKKNIVYAFTFKHYYYFFKCHTFIGTESVPHSLELRAANSLVARKMIRKNYKQVFLQHGVMYMVALNPTSRGAFLKGGNEMPMDAKIVCSSELEARHFIELGGFNRGDLYVTGLPFYDRTIKNKNADKILIMLTWRSWEYNIIATNYKESNYYKMIMKIIDNIPEKYKDKIYVLPHPLILDKFKNTDLGAWIPDIISYDKVLEETKLLITDYSSIAYSSFYRGSNIIFVWEELEECMKEYKSHLMLNKDNAFGDISYKYSDIKNLVEKNYTDKQNEEYIKRYKRIVEFNDGKNTDRLITLLKKDNII